jgi:hypothetical protein
MLIMIQITDQVLNNRLLEAGDTFVLVSNAPYSSPPRPCSICSYTVHKVGPRDIVCKNVKGDELRLKRKLSQYGVYYANDPALIPIRDSIRLAGRRNRAQKVLSTHGKETWDDELIEAVVAFGRRVQDTQEQTTLESEK